VQLFDLLQQFNWIDWCVLLVLLAYVGFGIQRGFMMGALDLAGMIASLGAGALWYRQAAGLILQFVQIPRAVATLGAFLAIVLIAMGIYSAVVNLLFRFSRPLLLFFGPIAIIDHILGAFPGVIKGMIFATLALLPFALFPLVPQISAGIERSTIGSQMVVAAVNGAPRLDSLMGRDLSDGLSFLTPPQTEEGMQVNFGQLGQLTPDPEAEERMLQMVNSERQKAGLKPLQMDDQLKQVARAHSMEMFQMGYFAHNSPVSGSPFDRMKQADITFSVAGENLAYAPNTEIAHEGLMNSPGHRANILRPEFGKVGIGVIKSEFRGSMFSQEFTN
jgi:uncharacterized protein YkwD/uncharacterized membrane protein required for colicin V production